MSLKDKPVYAAIKETYLQPGLTFREWAAALALQGLLSAGQINPDVAVDIAIQSANKLADKLDIDRSLR